jgi:hypothetical protein
MHSLFYELIEAKGIPVKAKKPGPIKKEGQRTEEK